MSSDFVEDLLLLAAKRVLLNHHEDGTLHKRIYPGDILAVSRWGNLYEHYGVYIGHGNVIHFAANEGDFGENAEIRQVTLATFEKDNDYRIVAFPKTSNLKGYHLYSAKVTDIPAKLPIISENFFLPSKIRQKSKRVYPLMRVHPF